MTNPANAASREARASEAVNALDWADVYQAARKRMMSDMTGGVFDQHMAREIAERIAATLYDTAPTDQAQRGGEVERIAQAIHAHSHLATSWWEDLAQDDRDTFEDAARAALAQSGDAS